MKRRSQRYDINSPWSRHGPKYKNVSQYDGYIY